MAYTLPANKILATLSNLVVLMETNDVHDGTGVDRLINFAHDTDLDFGGIKAVITADLPEVEDYSRTRSLTEVKDPTVDEQFISISKYKTIPLTLNRYITREAVLSETNFSTFMGYLLATLQEAKRNFIYSEILTTLKGWTPAKSTQTVSVTLTDVADGATASEEEATNVLNAKKISKALIKINKEIQAPTNAYNDLGYTENIDASKMVLIVNGKYDIDLNVDTFATLFNSDVIKNRFGWSETIDLPESKVNDDSVIGWLLQRGKISFGYGFQVATEFFNPATLDSNNYLHFSYYIDVVKGLTGIKIKKA